MRNFYFLFIPCISVAYYLLFVPTNTRTYITILNYIRIAAARFDASASSSGNFDIVFAKVIKC